MRGFIGCNAKPAALAVVFNERYMRCMSCSLQVSIKGRSGAVSRSPRQPAALRCTALTTSHQRCSVAAVEGRPLPLKTTALEWAGLAFNWPVMVHRCVQQGGIECSQI